MTTFNNYSRKDRDLIHFIRSAQYGRHHHHGRRNRGERKAKTNDWNLELVLSCDIVDLFPTISRRKSKVTDRQF